jgi:hypothetical protein
MNKEWTVWVGGGEVTDFYVTETEARTIAQMYRRMGYDDVSVQHVPLWGQTTRLDEETARFVEEFTKNEDRGPTEDEIAKFREHMCYEMEADQ